MSFTSLRPPCPALVCRQALLLLLVFLAGCSSLPTTGPSRKEIDEGRPLLADNPVQVVDVDDLVARRLMLQRRGQLFSESLGGAAPAAQVLGSGDSLEINIWEAPPATLFGSAAVDPRVPSSARATTLPEQMIDTQGFVMVPFAGRILAAGRSSQAVEQDIASRLKGKANQPEVLIRVLRNASSNVTVVGEVNASVRMPLTARGERLLDALAAAGGVRQSVSKTTVQITRGERFVTLPLDTVIRDPRQNVVLQPGDVVTAVFQSLSFTALGATGKNEEINFESKGISLAQALARAGGLIDSRSDAAGVFIFRLEDGKALDWPRQPATTTPDGLVPVVYRFNLRDPRSFFVMQGFPISDRDVLYVSNASAAELQKFLNLAFSVIYPIASTRQLFP